MNYCRVYWGTHGCVLPRDHEEDCHCDCCECTGEIHDESCAAFPPYYGSNTFFYGDDSGRKKVCAPAETAG